MNRYKRKSMVDAFCSVYTKDYRPLFKDDEPEKALPCSLFDPEENFLPEKHLKVIYDPQRDEEAIKRLIANRMQTIYQISYKYPGGRENVSTDPFSDEFMNHFNKVYEEKSQAVLRPPESSRRINGYSRFDLYYTGKTTYQDEISLEAYKTFKKDFEEGRSRLFRKKQLRELWREEERKRQEEKAVGN